MCYSAVVWLIAVSPPLEHRHIINCRPMNHSYSPIRLHHNNEIVEWHTPGYCSWLSEWIKSDLAEETREHAKWRECMDRANYGPIQRERERRHDAIQLGDIVQMGKEERGRARRNLDWTYYTAVGSLYPRPIGRWNAMREFVLNFSFIVIFSAGLDVCG